VLGDSLKQEIKRKLFHMLGGVYLLVYALLPRRQALIYLAGLGVVIIVAESIRLLRPGVNAWFMERLGSLARAAEARHVSGIFWTWLGCWLTMVVFSRRRIVLPALGFLVFGDAAAALIGKGIGKHHWPGHPHKSFEGSAAFAIAALICGLYFLPFWVVLPAALITAWIETRRLPWNDNFWIPLAGAACLRIFSWIMESRISASIHGLR
jgi:dolichol kinase